QVTDTDVLSHLKASDLEIPLPPGGYNKITCLEMAEHVGVRHLGGFFRQVYDMLDDDGVFFLQIAGLRKAWQFEDFTWGLFMNKYIFPGADASTPLGFVIDTLEGAGFEVKMVDISPTFSAWTTVKFPFPPVATTRSLALRWLSTSVSVTW